MSLSPLQRMILHRYRLYRESSPKLGTLMTAAAPKHIQLLLLMSVAMVISNFYLSSQWSWFVAGFGIGTIVRDFGSFRTVVRLWPAVSQVLDYQRIDELLDEQKS